MKTVVIVMLLILTAGAFLFLRVLPEKKELVLPEPTGYVIDTANVLSDKTEAELTKQLQALDPIAQVAVLTIPTTQPLDIETYSIKLAEKWQVGYKGKDNGIIFVIAVDDRKMRIEVGRGLEEGINDAKAGRILDEAVVPFFKNNDWNGGVLAGINAISQEVSQ